MQIFENVPEAFKSCFDTAKRKIAKNAARSSKNYGFTKPKHIRGDKTLKICNFGPNVIFSFLRLHSLRQEVYILLHYRYGICDV